jgi:hypothetical protein
MRPQHLWYTINEKEIETKYETNVPIGAPQIARFVSLSNKDEDIIFAIPPTPIDRSGIVYLPFASNAVFIINKTAITVTDGESIASNAAPKATELRSNNIMSISYGRNAKRIVAGSAKNATNLEAKTREFSKRFSLLLIESSVNMGRADTQIEVTTDNIKLNMGTAKVV